MNRFSAAALALASAASTATSSRRCAHADRTAAVPAPDPTAAAAVAAAAAAAAGVESRTSHPSLRFAMGPSPPPPTSPPSSQSPSQSRPTPSSSNPSSSSSSSSTPTASHLAATTPDMVPITADVLRAHYATFRSPSVDPSLHRVQHDIIALRESLLRCAPCASATKPQHPDRHAALHATTTTTTPGGGPPPASLGPDAIDKDEAAPPVATLLTEPMPTGLDSSMYRLRLSCEEAADRLDSATLPHARAKGLSTRLRGTASRVAAFQQRQTAHVDAAVRGLLPRDFRASLFAAARARSERANAAALTGLSLRARYKLLWLQQWRRREMLAGVGSANGVWRWVVRYLAGVPEPLLAFARSINAPDGPTEALRDKFSAPLAELVRFAVEMNALCAATAALSSSPSPSSPSSSSSSSSSRGTVAARWVDLGRGGAAAAQTLPGVNGDENVASLLMHALDVFDKEVDAFVELLEEVIVNSPFFVRPDEMARYRDGGGDVATTGDG